MAFWNRPNPASDWERASVDPNRAISRADIDAILEMVSQAYLRRDHDLLAQTLAADAEVVSSRRLGDAFVEEKHFGCFLIQNAFHTFLGGYKYSEYRMTLREVLHQSDSKWIVRCLVEYRQVVPGQKEAHCCNDEILTIEVRHGVPIITRAEIRGA